VSGLSAKIARLILLAIFVTWYSRTMRSIDPPASAHIIPPPTRARPCRLRPCASWWGPWIVIRTGYRTWNSHCGMWSISRREPLRKPIRQQKAIGCRDTARRMLSARGDNFRSRLILFLRMATHPPPSLQYKLYYILKINL